MIGQAAEAASRQERVYSIDDAWYDADAIYISYSETVSKVHYSLSDINGTIVSETKVSFIFKTLRALLVDGTFISLVPETPLSTTIYGDNDYRLQRTASGAELSSHGHVAEIPSCAGSIWENDRPLRGPNQLFFCGEVFDIDGNRRGHADGSALADSLNRDQPTAPVSAFFRPQWISIIRDGAVFVTQMQPIEPINELRIASQSLARGGAATVKTLALAPSSPGFRVVGPRLAYSPERLLLAPFNAEGRASLLCSPEQWETIDLPLHNFAIVDDEHRVMFLLALENLTVPKIRIRRFAY